MDFNNIPLGLNVPTQIPLNVKEYVANEITLSTLGVGNNLAYTYIDGFRIYCIQEKTIWEWQERGSKPVNSGLLATGDFTYPNNIVTFGITYSNKIYNFYKVEYVNKSDEKSYDATSLGNGQTIYKDKTVIGNNTVFNFKEINTTNAGTTGIPVLNGITTTGDDVILSGKRLKTTNLEITETVPGEILIDSPTDPNDVKFYVNENYTGGNSNGSLSKPYTNLYDAVQKFIGTGDEILPQYGGIGTIEFLSNVTVTSTAPKAMTYVSVNQLKINGNGFKLIYQGTRDYFISTEYLVGICPKTTSQKLDYNIYMSFENLVIESQTKHKIVNNLNYTSPIFPGAQNGVGMIFKNCIINDRTYLQELSDYTDTGEPLFGLPVLAQNILSKNLYMVKNKDVNWYNEGNFEMINCKLNGSSSTIVYNLNSSLSWRDVEINFNPYYVNYKDTTGDVYNPMEGIYHILNETNGVSGRTESYFRIENFKEFTQEAVSDGSVIGGVDAVCRVVGPSRFIMFNGSFYSEKVNNLIQLHNTTSYATLTNVNALSVEIADATYGAFKYTGTIPGSAKYIDVNLSIINGVKNWTTLQYIRPTAASATINGAYFSDKPDFPNNGLALAGGLVPGNVYYDTTGQIATRVV